MLPSSRPTLIPFRKERERGREGRRKEPSNCRIFPPDRDETRSVKEKAARSSIWKTRRMKSSNRTALGHFWWIAPAGGWFLGDGTGTSQPLFSSDMHAVAEGFQGLSCCWCLFRSPSSKCSCYVHPDGVLRPSAQDHTATSCSAAQPANVAKIDYRRLPFG